MIRFATHIPAFVRFGGMALMLGLVLANTALADRIPYELADPAIYAGGQPSLMGEGSKSRIANGLAALRKSGMYDAISAMYGEGSDDGALMMAIAIRESTGVLKAINQESKAACTFQIIPDNIAGWYRAGGYATAAHMQVALMTTPSECLKYGRKALDDQKSFASREGYSGDAHLDRALCGYAGETRMYKDLGFCWASDEYKITAARILGRTVEYVMTDKGSGKYARKIVKDARTGRVLAEIFLCKDHTQEIPLALAKMADTYRVTMTQAEQDAFFNELKTNHEKGIRYYVPPQQAICLDVLLEKQRNIRDIISGDIEGAIKQRLLDLMNTACTYATTQVETALNNLLTLACVPLPNLDFALSLDLPSLERTSCNGLSLSRMMSFSTGSMSAQDYNDGLSASLPAGTVPPVEGMHSLHIDAPMPMPLLQQRRETSDGVYEYY